MSNAFEINLASVPDRDQLVAEIWFGEAMLAELRTEGEEVLVELYPRSSNKPWVLPSRLLLKAIAEAESKLVGK